MKKTARLLAIKFSNKAIQMEAVGLSPALYREAASDLMDIYRNGITDRTAYLGGVIEDYRGQAANMGGRKS